MRRLLPLLTLLLALPGCTAATIHLKDGSEVEGTIERSDADNLYLADSEKTVVARVEIDSISHPGLAGAVITSLISTLVLASGAMATGIAINDGGERGAKDIGMRFGVPTLLMSAVLSAASIASWVNFGRSVSAASEPGTAKRPVIQPIALTYGEKTYYGAGISWSW